MELEKALKILDPETSGVVLAEYGYECASRVEAFMEARRVVCAELSARLEAEGKPGPLTLDDLQAIKRKIMNSGGEKPVALWTVDLNHDVPEDDPEYGKPDFRCAEWQMFDGHNFTSSGAWDDLSNYGKHFIAYRRPPEKSGV